MGSGEKSYIIVGAGVFGISTAYHLIRKYPNASVTVVDRDAYDAESRVAASWDWNKVVRADYDDIVYCELALEAQDIFRNDPLWQPHFHQTGIYWICRTDYAQDVIDNYKKLGRKAELAAVPFEEARKLYGGVFDKAQYDGVKDVLVNKTSGWAAAGDALRAVTKKSIELGVKYVTSEVSTLQFDSQNNCTGVRLVSGKVLEAAHVILCTGAYTSKLLELSAYKSGIKDLPAGDRIVAGGITTGMTTLDDKSYGQYAEMPVGVQGYTTQQGPFIGSLPPTKDRELKWWGQTIFSNTKEVVPGRYCSMPPPEKDYSQWNASRRMKEDIDHANNVFYGERGANWKMEKYRVCWDAFTTTSDFIISPHAASKGLYIATCGSFHGYKFFPVLGKYIVQMLEGDLPQNLSDKWAWNRDRPDPALNPDFPRVEMKYLLDFNRTSKL
ncbi:hypothetical protein LTR84_010854 [Exophiala bonariae]|uniref:FAD dependent oxidoreductase domain-containing protein n=1 Tax=Exophiala bonariae TaxID=1690606 RepID=A0AAV9NJZ9_9EURO|nr:hypothetical protein LTR84_010854 [Exophiala bonariae]